MLRLRRNKNHPLSRYHTVLKKYLKQIFNSSLKVTSINVKKIGLSEAEWKIDSTPISNAQQLTKLINHNVHLYELYTTDKEIG